MTLVPIIDNLAPLEPFFYNCSSNSLKPSHAIKRKINLRKKLLKSLKSNLSNKLRDHVKNLNVEIKNHFVYKSSVRRRIIPGDLKYLWDAVKISKDMNTPKLPHTMHLNNNEIPINELPEVFAEFFESKSKKAS